MNIQDALRGKHYDLLTSENDFLKVESAGDHISVGFKNDKGEAYSWWEPRYPFEPSPMPLPKQGKWDFVVEVPSPEETRAIFTCEDERHVLTLRVTDPHAHPKPVTVEWK